MIDVLAAKNGTRRLRTGIDSGNPSVYLKRSIVI